MKSLILSLIVACFATLSAADIPDIAHEDLAKAIASDQVVVIDVNGTDSYQKGHIPGALNWEAVQGELAKSLPADKSTLIVAYCGGPACGAYKTAAKAAMELGYTNVKHYSGGISGWKKAGADVEMAN